MRRVFVDGDELAAELRLHGHPVQDERQAPSPSGISNLPRFFMNTLQVNVEEVSVGNALCGVPMRDVIATVTVKELRLSPYQAQVPSYCLAS